MIGKQSCLQAYTLQITRVGMWAFSTFFIIDAQLERRDQFTWFTSKSVSQHKNMFEVCTKPAKHEEATKIAKRYIPIQRSPWTTWTWSETGHWIKVSFLATKPSQSKNSLEGGNRGLVKSFSNHMCIWSVLYWDMLLRNFAFHFWETCQNNLFGLVKTICLACWCLPWGQEKNGEGKVRVHFGYTEPYLTGRWWHG